jgi:predicted nucleic-acid-binding protein
VIALDTNALIRVLVEDDQDQAKSVQKLIRFAEQNSIQILILSEVLIETVWVLESVYHSSRDEISEFLDTIVHTPTFTFSEYEAIRKAVHQYKKEGDFADLVIVNQAIEKQAKKLFSFDKKLQKKFSGFVVEKIGRKNL